MKSLADKDRCKVNFEVGGKVLVKLRKYLQNLVAQHKYHKWDKKYRGPYSLLAKIGDIAYQLEIPPIVIIHDVFHISLQKIFHPTTESISITLSNDFVSSRTISPLMVREMLWSSNPTNAPDVLLLPWTTISSITKIIIIIDSVELIVTLYIFN